MKKNQFKKIWGIVIYSIIINFLFLFAYTTPWGIIPLVAFIWLIGTLIEKGHI